MVGEIPTPTEFVGDSPWLTNIGQARQKIDQKLVQHFRPHHFAVVNGRHPRLGTVTFDPRQAG
jgi:hypothetical protein